jgi:hypothetical protein
VGNSDSCLSRLVPFHVIGLICSGSNHFSVMLLLLLSLLVIVNGQNASLYSVGCSDGTREYFVNMTTHPLIAGCSGSWSLGGVKVSTTQPSTNVTCGRLAGNNGILRNGTGCSASDLCADGWHICR